MKRTRSHLIRLSLHVVPFAVGLWLIVTPMTSHADDVLPPADQRFSVDTQEVPHFQRHVLPLLRVLGCSGRECHGAASGQGGFRLSLFGYDFQVDHQTLLESEHPRVDLKQPEMSLILQKPTMQIDHGGGERFEKESWQYRLIESWIRGGAAPTELSDPQFDQLIVTPDEISGPSQQQLQAVNVVCVWSDGQQEDVTPLCHFQILDESVATIDDRGAVTIRGPGDTHLIAFYDNGVASIPIIVPYAPRGETASTTDDNASPIDTLIGRKLDKLGIAPSEICSDAEFLRRASLDIAGSLPSPEDIKDFLDDRRPDKRCLKIDELLDSPGYASYWGFKLGELWGNYSRDFNSVARESFSYHWYRWLESQLAKNVAYDEIVEGMVQSQSRLPQESYEQYVERLSHVYRDDSSYTPLDQETMPNYWYRTNLRVPKDAAMAFSYAFVGVRLECAECHKHPYDIWTNADLRHFADFFKRIKYDYVSDSMTQVDSLLEEFKSLSYPSTVKLVREGKPYAYKELVVAPPMAREKEENPGSYRNLLKDLATVRTKMAEARRSRNQKEFADAEARLQKLNRARLYQIERLIEKTEKVVKPDHPQLVKYRMNADALRREIQGLQTTKILNGIPADPQVVDDPRSVLMDWLRSADNPYFARLFVNRIWAAYFGRGIIEPVDDLNLANPPVNKPLLDYLSQGFIEHEYDIKWLHREITNSLAYQRSWKPNASNQKDESNFSRMLPRRISAEVFELALSQALNAEESDDYRFHYTQNDYQERLRWNTLLSIFGRPGSTKLCDCNRSNEPALMQSVLVQNGGRIDHLLRSSQWLNSMTKNRSTQNLEDLIESVYLRTLGRLPTYDETTTCRTHLEGSQDRLTGMQDLMWALLNSKEFWLIY